MNIDIGKFAGFCDGVKYAVENKKEYQERLSERIDSIKNVLDKCRKDEYVDNCKQLFNLSFHYSGRASLNALQNILNTP